MHVGTISSLSLLAETVLPEYHFVPGDISLGNRTWFVVFVDNRFCSCSIQTVLWRALYVYNIKDKLMIATQILLALVVLWEIWVRDNSLRSTIYTHIRTKLQTEKIENKMN